MLKLPPVVLDIEGFRQKKSGFIIKELSVCSHNYSDTVLSYPQVHSIYFPQVNKILTSGFQNFFMVWLGRAEITPIAICSKLFKPSNFVFRLPNFMQKELKRRTL